MSAPAMVARSKASKRARLRMRAGAVLVDGFFRGASRLGRLHPLANPQRHGVTVVRDVPYSNSATPEHRLDIYCPTHATGPVPVVFYAHGGGFRILSKDTHWLMALAYARRGYVVVSINYRLAPHHPFPAALQDACQAYVWVTRNIGAYGGDLKRLVLAGESAGANLATSLAIAACYPRAEPYARAVFDTGVVPSVVAPACGVLQVSDAQRFSRRKRIPVFIQDRLTEVEHAYLGALRGATPAQLELANPLLVLEQGRAPERRLPPFFAPVGTMDPLLDDTRRLKAALEKLGVPCQALYYPGEIHAFHAFVMRANARRCWRDTFAFLDEHLKA
jgi:acetyl esterase